MVSYSAGVNLGPGPGPKLKPICIDRARVHRRNATQKGPKLERSVPWEGRSNRTQVKALSRIKLGEHSQEEVGDFTQAEGNTERTPHRCASVVGPGVHLLTRVMIPRHPPIYRVCENDHT